MLPVVFLVLTVCLMALPTFTTAHRLQGYGGIPIKYGAWLVGKVYLEINHYYSPVAWAKITINSTDGNFTKTTSTNGNGAYKIYLPPDNYTVTVEYSHYTQTSNVTIWEDQVHRIFNIYLERPDMPEFHDHLEHKD